MDATTVYQYRYVLGFLGIAIVFAALALVVPLVIAPRGGHGADTLKTYESGIIPERGAWRQFSLAYYLYALLFLAVSVDVIYLFPVAVVFRLMHGWQVVVEVLAFIGIVALAVVYSWRTGAFSWD